MRRLLIGLASAALLATMLAGTAMAEKERVTICHKPGTADEETIKVSESAVNSHQEHGDYVGRCNVLAIAWTDADGDDMFGGYRDLLIAKLIDEDGDRRPSPGDTVQMGDEYRLRLFESIPKGTWRNKLHVVDYMIRWQRGWVEVHTPWSWPQGAVFRWRETPEFEEFYEAGFADLDGFYSWFYDGLLSPIDHIIVTEDAPSDPSRHTSSSTSNGLGDFVHVDVAIYYTP